MKAPNNTQKGKANSISVLIQNTHQFRSNVASQFVDYLNSITDKRSWHRIVSKTPINLESNREYTGVNQIALMLAMEKNGWTDSRFVSMPAIKKNHLMIEKGSKGTKTEFWFPYDRKAEKSISWDDYNSRENKKDIFLKAHYYTVFNAEQIVNLPESAELNNNKIDAMDIASKIAQLGNIQVITDAQDYVHTDTIERIIHIPDMKVFNSEYDYSISMLHEVIHIVTYSLMNELKVPKGVDSFIMQELTAEIASFMMAPCLIDYQLPTFDHSSHEELVEALTNAINADEKNAALFAAIDNACLIVNKLGDYYFGGDRVNGSDTGITG